MSSTEPLGKGVFGSECNSLLNFTTKITTQILKRKSNNTILSRVFVNLYLLYQIFKSLQVDLVLIIITIEHVLLRSFSQSAFSLNIVLSCQMLFQYCSILSLIGILSTSILSPFILRFTSSGLNEHYLFFLRLISRFSCLRLSPLFFNS